MNDSAKKIIDAVMVMAMSNLPILLQIASGLNKKVAETIKADPEAFKEVQSNHVDDYLDSVKKMREQFSTHGR